MPGTGTSGQESLKPAFLSLRSGLRSSVPCSIRCINRDDEEMDSALPGGGPLTTSDFTSSSEPLSIWPNAHAGQQRSSF